MPRPTSLGPNARIAAWRRAKGVTLVVLSKGCGLLPSALSQIENEKQHVRAEQMEAIARALGLTMLEFYDDRALRRAARGSAA